MASTAKVQIGETHGTYRLLKRLPKKVEVECLKCGQKSEISLTAFWQSSPESRCKLCKTAHNKKYNVGDTINGGWLITKQIGPQLMEIKCLGPLCNGSLHQRNPSDIGKAKGCRICYGNQKAKSEKTKKRQNKGMLESNKKRHREFCEREIGKIYGWLKITGVDGIFFECECLGDGPHQSKIKIRSGSVISGKTTSCGCMRKKQLLKTMQEKYGVNSIMDMPGHRQKVMEGLLNTFENGSAPEREVRDFVLSLGIDDVKKSRMIIDGKIFEIDALSESRKTGIEYNGLLFHSDHPKFGIPSRLDLNEDETVEEFEKRRTKFIKNYHLAKKQMAEEKGIRLIQIFSHEWENRKTQIQGFLKSVFGKNEVIINGRKCVVRQIDWPTAKVFLEENHIQGPTSRSDWSFACFYENKIVYAMTFTWHHRSGTSNGILTLSRMCGLNGVTVRGAMSKIMSYALPILQEDPRIKSIITWADLRFSVGASYEKNGWIKEEVSPPDYFYFDPNSKKIISKQNRRKSVVNTPDGMTEEEHAIEDGLVRVWDCGKIKFSYPIK